MQNYYSRKSLFEHPPLGRVTRLMDGHFGVVRVHLTLLSGDVDADRGGNGRGGEKGERDGSDHFVDLVKRICFFERELSKRRD